MSSELKPCPFCNDEMKLDPGAASFATGPGLVYVSCDCGAMGAGGKTRAEAIEVWNRRAPPAVTAKPDLAAPVAQASAKPSDSLVIPPLRAEPAGQRDAPASPLIPCAYRIGPVEFGAVKIEECGQIEGPPLWAVRRNGNCMNKDGEWEYEPMPSSRDDEFLARCRFASAQEALKIAAPVEQTSSASPDADTQSPAAVTPPQQAPDPIYLIRPKAGGTTWTECISEQSYDAAMRLGVYESRVVVEVGAAAGSVRDAALAEAIDAVQDVIAEADRNFESAEESGARRCLAALEKLTLEKAQ